MNNRSKLVLKWVLGLLLIVITASAIFIYWLYAYGPHLDTSSKAFVEENIPPIISSWSKEEFVRRASPELLASLSEDWLRHKFYNLSLLGPLKRLGGFSGQATIHIGQFVSATYTANAEFQNVPAYLQVDLIRQDDSWAISNLRVTVPVNGEQRTLSFTEVAQ